jgi:hypothetical protein
MSQLAAASHAHAHARKSRLSTKIAGLTAALVAVTALINAGYDVYASVQKLPRTSAEKVNDKLFRKYFNKPPLVVIPVPVKHPLGTVNATFSVYDEGDVYIEYGKQTQWFEFPGAAAMKGTDFSLFRAAHAAAAGVGGSVSPLNVSGTPQIASVSDSISGNVLTKSRLYTNGVLEQSQIDIRTGAILNVQRSTGIVPSSPPIQTLRVAPIDLELYKKSAVR